MCKCVFAGVWLHPNVIKFMFWILNHITERCESYLKPSTRSTFVMWGWQFSKCTLIFRSHFCKKFTQTFAEAFGAELTCELQWRKWKAGNRLGRKRVGKWREGGLGKLTAPFTCQSHKHTHSFMFRSTVLHPIPMQWVTTLQWLSFEVKLATFIRLNEIQKHNLMCIWTQVLVPVLNRGRELEKMCWSSLPWAVGGSS